MNISNDERLAKACDDTIVAIDAALEAIATTRIKAEAKEKIANAFYIELYERAKAFVGEAK